jgi:hypothetical protein
MAIDEHEVHLTMAISFFLRIKALGHIDSGIPCTTLQYSQIQKLAAVKRLLHSVV